jgi:hypothetical protein
MYRFMVTAALVLVYSITAIISVQGFASFFRAEPIIYAVGIALEFGKLVAIIYIHREWKSLKGWSYFYFFIIGILMLLTATEVLGFLSQTHGSGTKHTRSSQEETKQLKIEQGDLRDHLKLIEKTLSGLPEGYVTKRIQIRKTTGYEKKVNRLLQIPGELSRLKSIRIEKNESPVFSVAEIFGIDPGTITTFFIGLVVIVLEMLSIGLAVATSGLWMENGRIETAKKVGQNNPEKVAEIKTDQKRQKTETSQNRNSREELPEIDQDKINGKNGESSLYKGTAILAKTAETKLPEMAITETAEINQGQNDQNEKKAETDIGQYLEKFQGRYSLPAEKIAEITGKKRITTVVGWLENPDSIPVKELRKLRGWHGETKTG